MDTIIENWKKSHEFFKSLAITEKNISETIEVRDVPEHLKDEVAEMEKNDLFRRTFSHAPAEIKFVELDKIIVCQRIINLDYVKEIQDKFPKNLDEKALFDICIKHTERADLPSPIPIALNSYVYSNQDPNFRFLGGYPKKIMQDDIMASHDGGMPVAAIVLLFGYDFGSINVYAVNKRIILNNGIHRLYALREMGVKYAPVVVQRVQDPELEFPSIFQQIPKDYLLTHPRPAMIKGFFNEKLVHRIKIKNKVSNIKISWNSDKIFSPVI